MKIFAKLFALERKQSGFEALFKQVNKNQCAVKSTAEHDDILLNPVVSLGNRPYVNRLGRNLSCWFSFLFTRELVHQRLSFIRIRKQRFVVYFATKLINNFLLGSYTLILTESVRNMFNRFDASGAFCFCHIILFVYVGFQ